MRLPSPVQIGFESVRANVRPMVTLWMIAATMVLAYYFVPGMARVLKPVGEWQERSGWQAAFANCSFFCGVLPYVVYLCKGRSGPRHPLLTAVYPVDPPWLAIALGHIRSNVAKGLTASEIAEVAGRSYVAVEKAFKQKLGTTIQKEIMASRLETAQHLLAATHRPLADITKLSGFRSVQYLCLCFQKQFGCSPLAYRQSSGV